MTQENKRQRSGDTHACCSCGMQGPTTGHGISRRGFLSGVGHGAAGVALANMAVAGASAEGRESEGGVGTSLPPGATLKVQPALIYQIPTPQEKTSWRWYGGIQTMEQVHAEAKRLDHDLKDLAVKSDFPVEFLPVALVGEAGAAAKVAATQCDTMLMFGACGYGAELPHILAGGEKPAVMFLRHRTEPNYCQHVSTHAIFLRTWTDTRTEPRMDVHDVAVDDYQEVIWRLRALYGLKNAKGTTMLAIGGLQHYSPEGTKHGEKHARELWDYRIETISLEDFGKRLNQARKSADAVKEAQRRTEALLAEPGVTLATDRKFVFNSFLALNTVNRVMQETGATNFGFGGCMGRPVIEMLDTPPCLILALANDTGSTAFCHADLTHTVPGVLLRWISGKPTFVANSHFPHKGIFTVAHCAAPRKMNGRQPHPTAIMTHYESDYGAATKVDYPKGQEVTVICPAVDCSTWQGFRGKIIESPSRPACRSQMDIAIDGNWRRLLEEQVGFHVDICYDDYLREVGYALKKLGTVSWTNFSEPA